MTDTADDRARLAKWQAAGPYQSDEVRDLLRMVEDGIAAREALAALIADLNAMPVYSAPDGDVGRAHVYIADLVPVLARRAITGEA